MVLTVLRLLNPLRSDRVSEREWGLLLEALFAVVDPARSNSAELGRTFFDEEHRKNTGEAPPNIMLSKSSFDYFERAMREVKSAIQAENTPESSLRRASEIAMKHVENGGRSTILHAVDGQRSNSVRFARVLTGAENCEFCIMLASRGPVYRSESSAGSKTVNGMIESFHPGCDCKIVPVYNKANYPGRESWLEADRIYRQATKGVSGYKQSLKAMREYLKEHPISAEDVSAAA
mgnify:FL=1